MYTTISQMELLEIGMALRPKASATVSPLHFWGLNVKASGEGLHCLHVNQCTNAYQVISFQ
jgi:hypothetical protein